jgi:SAM-dependent methyltransferase
MNTKSPKELAFLLDLYVATDWGERFVELVDEHVELPREGRALYVAAGTGEHAMSLQQRAGRKLRFLFVDGNNECLELARAKAVVVNEDAEFQQEDPCSLTLKDDQFDLVLGDATLIPSDDSRKMVNELIRVARPGATVAFWLPTFSSFSEFFSIYWEALQGAGLEDHGIVVENLITHLPTVSDIESAAGRAGLHDVASWTNVEEFDFESGEEFFNSPLITDFLLPNWLQTVPEAARAAVVENLAGIIDEERHQGEFGLTLKATLVVGRKARLQ